MVAPPPVYTRMPSVPYTNTVMQAAQRQASIDAQIRSIPAPTRSPGPDADKSKALIHAESIQEEEYRRRIWNIQHPGTPYVGPAASTLANQRFEAVGVTQRYLGLVAQYQNQHFAILTHGSGVSSVMYPTGPGGSYVYQTGQSELVGTRFQANVLTLGQQQALDQIRASGEAPTIRQLLNIGLESMSPDILSNELNTRLGLNNPSISRDLSNFLTDPIANKPYEDYYWGTGDATARTPMDAIFVGRGANPLFSPLPGSVNERFGFDEYGKVLGAGDKFEPAYGPEGIPINSKMGNGEYVYVGEYHYTETGETVSRYYEKSVGSFVDFNEMGAFGPHVVAVRSGGSPGAYYETNMAPVYDIPVAVTGVSNSWNPIAVSAAVQGNTTYGFRNDAVAIWLEAALQFGDVLASSPSTLTGGLIAPWTPGADLLTRFDQNANPTYDTFQANLAAVEAQKPQYDQLGSHIASSQAQLNHLAAGKINSQGQFIGTSDEYSKYIFAVSDLNADIEQYSKYGDAFKGVIQSGFASGAIIPAGDGGYQPNPDFAKKYGAFSDWSADTTRWLRGGTTEAQIAAYEQSPSFKNDNALAWFGEGSWKVLTNPVGMANSALLGIEMYAGMGLLGAGFTAMAPARVAGVAVAPVGILQTIGSAGLRTMASPVFQYGLGAAFMGAGIWGATEGFTAPVERSVSNLGGMTIHMAAMTAGVIGVGYSPMIISGLGKGLPVSLNYRTPLRSAREGTFNYVTTLSTKMPFSKNMPTVRAYAMSGIDVTGIRIGRGSPINAMRDITIVADPIFNVRDAYNTGGAHTMTEPQRMLLDPFFRAVTKGQVAEPLVNAVFDMKANIGADVIGGSETILKYENAQPAGTATQTGIDASVQFAVHEVLAEHGGGRLGSIATTDWLSSKFMRDTIGSDIDADLPAAQYKAAIDALKVEYAKNTEPVRLPATGGRFSLEINPETETIISPSTIEARADVRWLEAYTRTGKTILQQTPEYGIESKASRSLGGRMFEYTPDNGVYVKIKDVKFAKDIADIYAGSRGIARTAYEQNQFRLGEIYEGISNNLDTYSQAIGQDSIIRSIPNDILATPEAIQAKTIAGIRAGRYRLPSIFGLDIPMPKVESEYPTAPYRIRATSPGIESYYSYPISVGLLAIAVSKSPEEYPIAPQKYITESLYPEYTLAPEYPVAEQKYPTSTKTGYPTASKYPESSKYPKYTITPNYPESTAISKYPTTLPPQKYPTTIEPQKYPTTIEPQKYPPTITPPKYPPTVIPPEYPTTNPPPEYPPWVTPPEYPPWILFPTPQKRRRRLKKKGKANEWYIWNPVPTMETVFGTQLNIKEVMPNVNPNERLMQIRQPVMKVQKVKLPKMKMPKLF